MKFHRPTSAAPSSLAKPSRRTTVWFVGGLLLAGLALWPSMSLGFTLPKLVVLHAVALGWIFSSQSEPFPRLMSTWTGRLTVAYFGLLGMYTVAFSIAPWTSLWGGAPQMQGFMTQWLYLTFFVMGLMHAGVFSRGVVAMNLGVTAYGLGQILGLDPLARMWDSDALLGRTFSTLGNPNFLGAFLALTVFLTVARLPTRYGLRDMALWANVIVLLGTVSKGAYLGVAVALVAGAWFERKKLFALARHHQKKLLATLVVMGMVGLWGVQTWTARYELSSEPGRSWGARVVLWSDTVELLRQQPWGYGLETLGYVYGLVQSPELFEYDPFTVMVDRAHNEILDRWVTAGPLTVMAWISLMTLALHRGLKHPNSRELSLGLLAYMVTLLVGFETVLTGAVAWGMIGSVLREVDPPKSIPHPVVLRGAWVVLAIPLLIAFPVTIQQARADLAYYRAEQALTAQDYDTALAEYATAISLTSTNRTHLLKTLEVALIVREQTLSTEDQARLDALIDTALDRLARLTNNHDPFLYSFLAWEAAISMDQDRALRGLELAEALAPNHPLIHKLAYHVYEQLNEPEKAALELETLRALLPSYIEEAPTSDATRIFWKTNPWLETLLNPAPSTL